MRYAQTGQRGKAKLVLAAAPDRRQPRVWCKLVGNCYGAEPPVSDEQFGRVSYTQYEALYAKSKGKKIWYLECGSLPPQSPQP
jgi:hypothetical protein